MDHKKEVDAYCRHLVREIKNSGVKVKYNTRATKELVKELNPMRLWWQQVPCL